MTALARRAGAVRRSGDQRDVCSRNGIFLTGTGVSDDHSGQDWLGQASNFVTWAHAPTRELADLLAGLSVDTTAPRFVRVEVRDRTGTVLALSNPVWLLRDVPEGGIPAPRRAR